MSVKWSLLSKVASKARSSHCVSLTARGLVLLYGGELQPRIPVDTGGSSTAHGEKQGPKAAIHVFDLKAAAQAEGNHRSDWLIISPNTSGAISIEADIPEPRVGSTTVWDQRTECLYMWGGRGGVDMSPLSGQQAGIWRAHVPSDLTSLTGGQLRWERLAASNEEEAPAPRSYHAAAICEDSIYIHAGCPASGRLGTLHAFDITHKTWRTLSNAPDPGRGGTSLVVVSLSKEEGPVILRFAGFAGYELGADHAIDIYSIKSNSWRTVIPSPDGQYGFPGARSVYGLVPFTSNAMTSAVALLFHGERDPSNLGHAGAGAFWDDVWMLERSVSDEDNGGLKWRYLPPARGSDVPEGRGWFPGAAYFDAETGQSKVAMFGGLLSSNARSDELWMLDVQE